MTTTDITHLKMLADAINILTNNPTQHTSISDSGLYVCNVGCFYIDQLSSKGFQLRQVVSSNGDTRQVTNGYYSPSILFNQMQMFIAGLEYKNT